MEITFSKNLYDNEGRAYSSGVFLHFGENVIIRAENSDEVFEMAQELLKVFKELKEGE